MTSLWLALGWVTATHAASLDNVEVGGAWGTPTATNPTALWWNPAGVAAGEGHQLLMELAPTFASFSYDRADPNGGVDEYGLAGFVPFAGATSDLTVPGFGVGLALAVPTVRGGKELGEPGSGRYHMRESEVQAIHVIGALGYEFRDRVAVGFSAHLVDNHWSAVVDTETLPDLSAALEDFGQTPSYTDDDLEDPRYAATLDFQDLRARSFTWSFGVRAKIGEQATVGVAHIRPYDVDHRGAVDAAFSCPPTSDAEGRAGSELYGLCDNTLRADASVAYAMPGRWHLGMTLEPVERVRIEAMGGWVGWGRFTDFDIQVSNVALHNDFETDLAAENTPSMVEQKRKWARENQDSFFLALDTKVDVARRWTLGVRALFDQAAVPDRALSTNNWDADSLALTGLAAVRPWGPLLLSASYGRHFIRTREISTSGYQMTLDEDRADDRWYYPHGNGTYTGSIQRVGLTLGAEF